MLELPLYVELFVGIPESFLIVIVGFALFNIRVNLRDALLIAVISALVSYFVRQIPVIIFGVHTLIGIVVLTVLARYLLKSDWGKAFIAILSGLILVVMVNSVVLLIGFYITGTGMNDINTKPWMNIIFFIPEALIMISLYLYMVKKHVYIINLENGDKHVG